MSQRPPPDAALRWGFEVALVQVLTVGRERANATIKKGRGAPLIQAFMSAGRPDLRSGA